MRRFSFTLTELLAVVAIIALLMAVLLPALRSSREKAKAVLCGSNIKQLLNGLLSYEAENQILPYSFNNKTVSGSPPEGYPGHGQIDRRGWWWFSFIEGFYRKSAGKRTVVCCPSKRLNDNPMLINNILCGNYGINRSVCKSSDDRQSQREEFVGIPLRSSNISRPSETLLLVDSGYAMICWWQATDKPPVTLDNIIIEDTSYIPGLWINKDRNLLPGQMYDAIYGRHPNKTVNVGFVDGHVKRIEADNLFIEKINSTYKNKSPLWVPK